MVSDFKICCRREFGLGWTRSGDPSSGLWTLFFVIPAYQSCRNTHVDRASLGMCKVQASGIKLQLLSVGHKGHALWPVHIYVSFGARFLKMQKILKSFFLPNLWKRSDAGVLGEAGGWRVVQLC